MNETPTITLPDSTRFTRGRYEELNKALDGMKPGDKLIVRGNRLPNAHTAILARNWNHFDKRFSAQRRDEYLIVKCSEVNES